MAEQPDTGTIAEVLAEHGRLPGKGAPCQSDPAGGFPEVFAEHGRPPASHGAVDLIPRGVEGRWTVLRAPHVVLEVAFLYLLLYPDIVAKTGVGGILGDRLLSHNSPGWEVAGFLGSTSGTPLWSRGPPISTSVGE